MTKLEQSGRHYLFKMKKSARVKELINQYRNERRWLQLREGWEAKETTDKLSGREMRRHVVLVRRQLKKEHDIDDEIIIIVQHYRGRAYIHNNGASIQLVDIVYQTGDP